MRNVLRGSIDGGFRNPPVRWLMLAAPFSAGAGIFVFYAAQPYLLELYGDKTAYGIAGLAAAIVAGVQIVGGLTVSRVRRLFGRRTSALLIGGAVNVVLVVLLGLTHDFVVALLLLAAGHSCRPSSGRFARRSSTGSSRRNSGRPSCRSTP